MAAVHALLLLLTTIAPYAEPYATPPYWDDTSLPDSEGGDILSPCAPFLKPEGERECPANEHYEPCGDICIQSCIQYECPLSCCVEGCFCDDGWVRGVDGTCVPLEECPPPQLFHETNRIEDPDTPNECGPDEYISCDSQCQRNCSNYHDVIFCDKMCILDCVCIPPKIRGPLGNCLLPHQCDAPSTVFKRDDLLICNYIRMMDPKDPRCSKKAMPCNDPFGCPGDVTEDDNLQREILNKIAVRNGKNSGAPCFPGTDVKGPATCGANEHYEECGAICMETCFDYECPLQCCVEGCFCDEGFVRDPSLHTCIPKEHCSSHHLFNQHKGSEVEAPKGCRAGELLTCESRCERTCENYREEYRKCPDECRMGCVCLPPKVRGPGGSCVHPKECPPSRETMLEEHMKMAAMICNFVRIMGSPPAWSDSCPIIVHECTDPAECFEDNSSPPLLGQFSVCRKNEYLNVLPSCPVTCDNYRDPSKGCELADRVVPRCDCKEGMVRDAHGGCVPPENCPNEEVCTDPNGCPSKEESSTPSLQGQFLICRKNEFLNVLPSCPVTCDNYRKKTKECAVADIIVPRCDCKRGLVRDSHGGCIPPANCPNRDDSKKCPEHEEWKSCGSACNQTCEVLPCTEECVRGCFCREPRVRGPDGACILKEECPPKSAVSIRSCPRITCEKGCHYDMNSTSCPVCVCLRPWEFKSVSLVVPDNCQFDHIHHQGLCQSYDNWNRTAASSCHQRAWRMASFSMLLPCEGGLFGGVQFVCCPERATPPECPKNESWHECGSICPKTCSNRGEGGRFCPAVCLEGCFCESPLVRGPSGHCIPLQDCP